MLTVVRQVKVIDYPPHKPGDIVPLTERIATELIRQGRVSPEGWDPNIPKAGLPMNRVLHTGRRNAPLGKIKGSATVLSKE